MSLHDEDQLKTLLKIESWRGLSREKFVRFLDALPETDPEVALALLAQIPDVAKLAQAALDDAAKAFDSALTSNDRSQETVYQLHLESLAILRAELQKPLTDEQWLRVLDDIRELNATARLKDTENKQFLSEQLRAKLAVTVTAAASVAVIVLTAAKSGGRASLGASRLFKSLN